MIFKKELQQVKLLVSAALIIICNCINDPSNKGWEPEYSFFRENNFQSFYKVLCDKNGKYYGLTYYNVITFDKAVLDAGYGPDTLPGSQRANNIFLDRNHDLIVLYNNGVNRYRTDTAGFQVEYIDNSSFRLINMDNGIAMLQSWPNGIFFWDGVSITLGGYIPDTDNCIISGVFFHNEGLDVFTNTNHTLTRLFVNGTSCVETKIPTPLISIDMITKKWHTYIGTGYFSAVKDRHIIFSISSQDSLHVIDTIDGCVYDFIETDSAIYLNTTDYIYRITSGSISSKEIDYRISGPLFLDQNGRPAIFYQNTCRNIYIDSLYYDYEKSW